MPSLNTRLQPLYLYRILMDLYVVGFLISHGNILKSAASMINYSCFLWWFHHVKLDPRRWVLGKTGVPMLCATTIPEVQPLEVVATSTLPVVPIKIPIYLIILAIPMISHICWHQKFQSIVDWGVTDHLTVHTFMWYNYGKKKYLEKHLLVIFEEIFQRRGLGKL